MIRLCKRLCNLDIILNQIDMKLDDQRLVVMIEMTTDKIINKIIEVMVMIIAIQCTLMQ